MSFHDQREIRIIQSSGCLVVALLFFSLCLMPIIFVDMLSTALQNLHLNPYGAALVVLGLLFGSLVNLPLYKIQRTFEIRSQPVNPWGGMPGPESSRWDTVVAVNVGGCLIPLLLAAWLIPLVASQPGLYTTLFLGIGINIFACYRFTRLVPGLGIVLPTFLSPLISLLSVWIGIPGAEYQAYQPAVAYLIGISGPLIGADLLHWKDFERLATGVISIGGAGTWDGIVLSGLLAAFLA